MEEQIFDVVIIGAGPIGLACGIEAVKNELSYVIIDQGALVNSIYNYPLNMTFFSSSDRLEIGGVPFVSIQVRPTRAEAMEYYRRVKDYWKLNVHTFEKAKQIQGYERVYKIVTEKDEYIAKNVIIATGFYNKPNLINIPGENLPHVSHYYREPHPYIDKNVTVIGGGNSAVDAALEIYRKGGKVTMVVMNANLDNGVKYWIKPDVENRIKEGSIKAYFNTKVREIRERDVILDTNGGEVIIESDYVLAMTGYQPDFRFLLRTGIEFTEEEKKEPVYDPVTFQTNKKNVYIAGVVCGGMNTSKLFIENSRKHAVDIFENIVKEMKDRKMR